MAQNNNESVIKSLSANSYTGTYEAVSNGLSVSGNFNTNGEKVINNIRGRVLNGDAIVLSFDAFKNGANYRYNFSDVADISQLPAAAAAIAAVIALVEAELAAPNE